MDIRPPLSAALDAFGLPCVVTPPSGESVETTAIWLPWQTDEYPVGGNATRSEPVRRLVLPLSEVLSMPKGTVVRVADDGSEDSPVRNWEIDSTERVAQDEYRVTVKPGDYA